MDSWYVNYHHTAQYSNTGGHVLVRWKNEENLFEAKKNSAVPYGAILSYNSKIL